MFRLSLDRFASCDGVSRRQFVQLGALAGLGLGLPQWLRAQAAQPVPRTDVSCILLWAQGGPSHLDTFDPKPDAPTEIRGEFGVVKTTDPTVYLCEHLPRLAQQFDKYSIIRGGDPQNGSHGVADYMLMTGHRLNPAVIHPCYGSVIAKQRGYRDGLFPFVQIGANIDRRFNAGIAGLIGDQFNPFEVIGDPNNPNFRVRDLSLANAAEAERLERRRTMLQELEKFQKRVEAADGTGVQARDAFYEKAFGLITSPQAKEAFDLKQEPDKLRAEYGRNPFGQGCLLARRLVEAGVHFVTVTDGGWDTHQNNFTALKGRQLPKLDQAFGTLLRDLADRGRLEKTLVIWMGDFGRTPRINPSAGRDHWSTATVICMGGGGVPPGRIIGRTDGNAERVVDQPVRPADLAATVYALLGVPPETWFTAPDGRPIPLLAEGHVVRDLLSTTS